MYGSENAWIQLLELVAGVGITAALIWLAGAVSGINRHYRKEN